MKEIFPGDVFVCEVFPLEGRTYIVLKENDKGSCFAYFCKTRNVDILSYGFLTTQCKKLE